MTEELMRLNRDAAAREGVESAVHEKDFIYWYLVDAPHNVTISKASVDYYFADAAHSANKLANLVRTSDLPKDRKLRLLEFASGYGRVSRFLKKDPLFDLVCCDIHPGAIEFLTRELGVKTLQSVSSPLQFTTPGKFDVIFALSFFSHMPRATFGPWLRALFEALDVGGYLIFTNHGWTSAHRFNLCTLPPDGFIFSPATEQKDIDASEYGCTIAAPEFVFNEIRRQAGSQNIRFQQAGWWDLQDVWMVRRDKLDLPPTPPSRDRQLQLVMLDYFEKRLLDYRKHSRVPWIFRPQAWLTRAYRNLLRKALSDEPPDS
jgi:SAM-dependent methyltransferase